MEIITSYGFQIILSVLLIILTVTHVVMINRRLKTVNNIISIIMAFSITISLVLLMHFPAIGVTQNTRLKIGEERLYITIVYIIFYLLMVLISYQKSAQQGDAPETGSSE